MALLKYTALRLAIFIVVAVALYALGVRSLFANALLAILISGIASVVLLNRVRDEAAQGLELRVGDGGPMTRLQRKVQAATTAEDAADDAARAGHAGHVGHAGERLPAPGDPAGADNDVAAEGQARQSE